MKAVLRKVEGVSIHFMELNVRQSKFSRTFSPNGKHLWREISRYHLSCWSDLPRSRHCWFANTRSNIKDTVSWLNSGQLNQPVTDVLRRMFEDFPPDLLADNGGTVPGLTHSCLVLGGIKR